MPSTDILELIYFLIGGIIISLVVNKLLLSFSQSLGIRNKNDVVIRWSNESKPSLGGISMYVAFVFSILAFAVFYSDLDLFEDSMFLGLLAAGSLAFVVGLADDAYNTKPLLKLLGQISCGLLLVYSGSTINLFHNVWIDSILTVIWVITIMNSLNMLDNMDGITGTVTLFILTVCMISYFILKGFEIDYWIIVLVAQIGAIIGFLRYNINPSKMFMGDAGSQFIGLFVAFYSIQGLWNTASALEIPAWSGMLVVLTAFTPAASDTLSVVINRLKRGQSPMVGGKDHTTHHLVYRGLNDFQVWKVFLMISVLSSIVATAFIFAMYQDYHFVSLAGLLFFLVVFWSLYRNTLKYKEPKPKG